MLKKKIGFTLSGAKGPVHRIGGFTLIELLVVIAIIGILAVAVAGNFITPFERSRDARRKADINTIQKALEAYYSDQDEYPADIYGNELCPQPDSCFLTTVPQDPRGMNYNYNAGADSQSYSITATLERDDEPENAFVNCTDFCYFRATSPNIRAW